MAIGSTIAVVLPGENPEVVLVPSRLVFAPLAFFMAYVPQEPSVIGMGMMTTALGCGVMAAGYIYYSRESADE